jgi:hypothetical protein
MGKISAFLGRPGIYVFLLLFALFFRFKHEICFPHLTSDYAVQMGAAKNYTEGKGFSGSAVSSDDLSKPVDKQMRMWPIGYPVLLVISWHILHNWFWAAILLQLVGVGLLLWAMLRILLYLGVSKKIRSLFLIFIALSSTPFYYLGTTDLLTAAIFLWCVSIILKQSRNNDYSLTGFIVIGLLSALNCTIRFAYIPNLVIIPAFYFILWFFRKDRRMMTGVLVTAGISFLCTFVFFTLFKIDSGRTSFIQNLIHWDLFWNHLKWFDSFPIKAFFYMSPLEYRLPSAHPGIIRLARFLIHACSLFVILLFVRRYLIRDKAYRWLKERVAEKRLISEYLLLFVIVSAVVVGLMSLQSLTTGPEGNSFGPPWMPRMWTFVYATRYFALPMVMLQILLFAMLSELDFRKDRLGSLLAIGLTSAAMSWSALLFVYSNYQIHAPGGNGGDSFWSAEKVDVSIFKKIGLLAEESKVPIVYSGYDSQGAPVFDYCKAIQCTQYAQLIGGPLRNSAPVRLVMKLPAREAMNLDEQKFSDLHKAQLLMTEKKFTLYLLDL